jgi:putative addiction module component (TIGR02574 family)
MFRDAESLIQEGLQLPPVDRLRVADRLYESVPEDDDATNRQAWLAEAKRRLDEYRRGEGTTVDPAVTFAKTKQMIAEARRSQK